MSSAEAYEELANDPEYRDCDTQRRAKPLTAAPTDDADRWVAEWRKTMRGAANA